MDFYLANGLKRFEFSINRLESLCSRKNTFSEKVICPTGPARGPQKSGLSRSHCAHCLFRKAATSIVLNIGLFHNINLVQLASCATFSYLNAWFSSNTVSVY